MPLYSNSKRPMEEWRVLCLPIGIIFFVKGLYLLARIYTSFVTVL